MLFFPSAKSRSPVVDGVMLTDGLEVSDFCNTLSPYPKVWKLFTCLPLVNKLEDESRDHA